MTQYLEPLDPGLAIRESLDAWTRRRPRLAFESQTLRAARAWQRKARARFLEILGPPPPRVALRRQVLESRRMDGYTRTRFTLTTAPKLKALCWLCLPDGVHRNDPQPALVATPGHGFGCT